MLKKNVILVFASISCYFLPSLSRNISSDKLDGSLVSGDYDAQASAYSCTMISVLWLQPPDQDRSQGNARLGNLVWLVSWI